MFNININTNFIDLDYNEDVYLMLKLKIGLVVRQYKILKSRSIRTRLII